MAQAIALARAQLGRTSPNPSVGCVLVRDGEIVGSGATGDGGHPHAEEYALREAGARARGAVAYVTLEPCHSRSSGAPGCSDRLINAGVRRVVAACEDPHPTAMDGFAKLRGAGVTVEVGLAQDDAFDLTAGFFMVLDKGRPLVGVSLDAESYDAEFRQEQDESIEDALARMAKDGKTRVWVSPGTPLEAALRSRGLIDRG